MWLPASGTLPLPPGGGAVGCPHAAHSPAKGTSSSGRTEKIPCGPSPWHPHNANCQTPNSLASLRRIFVSASSAEPHAAREPPQGGCAPGVREPADGPPGKCSSYVVQSNSSLLPGLPPRPTCRAGTPSTRAGTGESESYERDAAGPRRMARILDCGEGGCGSPTRDAGRETRRRRCAPGPGRRAASTNHHALPEGRRRCAPRH